MNKPCFKMISPASAVLCAMLLMSNVSAQTGTIIYVTTQQYSIRENLRGMIVVQCDDAVIDLGSREVDARDYNYGIQVEGRAHVTIKNGIIKNAKKYGLYVHGYSSNVAAENLTIRNTAGAGVRVENATAFKITDCTIKDAGGHGINVSESYEPEVLDNAVYDNNGLGIRLYRSHRAVAGGNNVEYNASHGIQAEQTSGIISDNHIYGNAGHGIYLFDLWYSLGSGSGWNFGVDRNQLVKNKRYGLYLAGSTDYVSVQDNEAISNSMGTAMEDPGCRCLHNYFFRNSW